jgi:hypothetical protein
MQPLNSNGEQQLSYFRAVESRLFCKLGGEYRGLEAYATRKITEAAAAALIYCVATDRLKLPAMMTAGLTNGSLYAVASYQLGIKVGFICGLPLAAYLAYSIAANPVATADAKAPRQWRLYAPARRWRYVGHVVMATISEQALLFCFFGAALAIYDRYRIGRGLLSGLFGGYTAFEASLASGKLLGGITVWNRMVTSDEHCEARVEKGWYWRR